MGSASKENPRLWYIRRNGDIQGPFPAEFIRRFALLGRVRRDDELSTDRASWRPLVALPELGAAELLRERTDPDRDAQRLASLRRWEDERGGDDRRGGASEDGTGRRHGGDRRRSESAERVVRKRRGGGARVGRRESYFGRYVFLILFIATIVGLAVLFPDRYARDTTQCNAAPGPGVNWSDCHKEGVPAAGVNLSKANLNSTVLAGANLTGANLDEADLDYAVLNLASLRGAYLAGASLVGASLRQADLSGADLRGANLSYAILAGAVLAGADLTQARLDNAVWVNGRVCAPKSEGRCVITAAGHPRHR